MGGQVADHGTISDAAGTVVARVVDVQRAPNGQALHTVEVEGELVVGANYKLEIDHSRRHRVMKTTQQLTSCMLPFTTSLVITQSKPVLLTSKNSCVSTSLTLRR
mgnify:FL=1